MNILLSKKLEEVSSCEKFECWYLVKQDTTFWKQCYYVSILDEYINNKNIKESQNLEDYFKEKIEILNKEKKLTLSVTHRALRIGYYYGLITDSRKEFKNYKDAEVTEVFKYIKKITKGNFEKTELYSKTIRQQIEKMYISSNVDEEKDRVRSKFRLFPVIFLYKVLLEVGRLTGEYSISKDEYVFFISTEGKYENYLKTVLLIVLSRTEENIFVNFYDYKEKIDSRFNLVLEQLETIEIKENTLSIKDDCLDYIENLVLLFECKKTKFIDPLELAKKNISIQDFLLEKEIESRVKYEDNIVTGCDRMKESEYESKKLLPVQKIYFGPPGTGKSYKVSEIIREKQIKLGIISEYHNGYNSDFVYRTTIYPEYDYYDFIGSVMPIIDSDKNITYRFKPGIFTLALEKSLKVINQNIPVYLVIEEMSRGNIASIFGDIFQLLDRAENGNSEYKIDNDMISNYLAEKVNGDLFERKEIFLPPNLNIIGTVNTSDQNVFVMDTAFKRRFEFEYISIDPIKSKDEEKYLNDFKFILDDIEYNWIDFYQKLNNYIVTELDLPEDKQIGQFFIKFNKESYEENYNLLKNKLLQYLWEDIELISMTEQHIFNRDYKCFSKIYSDFEKSINVFSNDFIEILGK